MSLQLEIQNVRHVLIRLEETIIFALIERAQFLRNHAVYEAGRFGNVLEGQSLCGYLLLECERTHAKVRRYTSPDEHPFFANLPPPVLPPIGYSNNPLIPNQININNQIRTIYETKILDRVTRTGDDQQYGSTAVCDVSCLQALSKRIHYGKFVAESKFRHAAPALQAAMAAGDGSAILAAITDTAVENDVLSRVHSKARTYTNEFKHAAPQMPLQPDAIRSIYAEIIIPLNKQVQVEYLLLRHSLVVCPPLTP